jgi:hypothetical protein
LTCGTSLPLQPVRRNHHDEAADNKKDVNACGAVLKQSGGCAVELEPAHDDCVVGHHGEGGDATESFDTPQGGCGSDLRVCAHFDTFLQQKRTARQPDSFRFRKEFADPPNGSRPARKSFFSEEKNQKTFIPPPRPRSKPWPRCLDRRRKNKVFLLLFLQKKKILPSTP